MILETNPNLGPHEDKVVRKLEPFIWQGDIYYGASALAMYKLSRTKGYTLVHHTTEGVNAFYIRNDVLRDKGVYFTHQNNVEALYSSTLPRQNFTWHSSDWLLRTQS